MSPEPSEADFVCHMDFMGSNKEVGNTGCGRDLVQIARSYFPRNNESHIAQNLRQVPVMLHNNSDSGSQSGRRDSSPGLP